MIDLYWCEECGTRLSTEDLGDGDGILVTGRAWCKSHRESATNAPADAKTLHGQSSGSSAAVPSSPKVRSRRRSTPSRAEPSTQGGNPGVLLGVGATLVIAIGVVVFAMKSGSRDPHPGGKTVTRSAPPRKTAQPHRQVHARPAEIIRVQPTDRSATAGESVSFTATSNEGDAKYQWRRNGKDIAGETSGTLRIQATQPEDNGATFDVVVTGAKGAATSKKVKLTVRAKVVEAAVKDPVVPTGPVRVNLALRKPVKTAGKHEGTHVPSSVVDGNVHKQSAWFGAPAKPQWIQIDLQSMHRIDSVHLHWYTDHNRYYQYRVQVSKDGRTWSDVTDARNNRNPATPTGVRHPFDAVDGRYVRLMDIVNSINTSVHLVECKVFGEPIAPAEPAVANVKALDLTADQLQAFVDLLAKGKHADAKAAMESALEEADSDGLKPALRSAVRVAALFAERELALRKAYEPDKGEKVSIHTHRTSRRGILKDVDDTGVTVETQSIINGKVRGRSVKKLAWSDLSANETNKRLADWKPDAEVKAVADAMLAMANGDPKKADSHLKGAPDHPLTKSLKRMLREQSAALMEGQATDAWAAIRKRGREKMNVAQARKLLTELTAFEKECATTDAVGKSSAERMTLRLHLRTLGQMSAHGLIAEYFENKNWQGRPCAMRVERKMRTAFGGGFLPGGLRGNDFSIRWTGVLRVPKSGRYTFKAQADDRITLRLNGKDVGTGPHELKEGALLKLELKYVQFVGGKNMRLLWTGPGISEQTVPLSALRHLPSTFQALFKTQMAGNLKPGLATQYYRQNNFSQAHGGIRVSSKLEFDWGEGIPIQGVGKDNFAVEWYGYIKAPKAGPYAFRLHSDDGSSLWIDGKRITKADSSKIGTGTATLSGRHPHSIRVRFQENGGFAFARLYWSGPGLREQIVPASAFFYTPK